MATQIAERRADPVAVIRQNLATLAPELKMALPAHVTVEKFSRVAMTAIQNNPDLLQVDRKSLFSSIVRLAQDGLLPDGREAAIVKFGDKAQAMPMIAGILKKIRQSGEVAYVSAQVVYELDEFVWKLGFEESVEHQPPKLDQPRGKPIGAYATAVLKDGSRLLEVMSFDEIEKVRSVSRAKGNGPWVQWWGEMARKTVMRRLSKRLPMSSDLDDQFERDATMQPEGHEAAERPAIEHEPAPVSRLDRLEQHIQADDEPLEGEIVEAEEDQPAATTAPGRAPDAPQQSDELAGSDYIPEGRADADMGEAHNDAAAGIIDKVIAAIDAATTASEVSKLVDDHISLLSDDEYTQVMASANARTSRILAETRAKAGAGAK